MSLKEGKHSPKVINSTQIDALMILLIIKNELQFTKHEIVHIIYSYNDSLMTPIYIVVH